ncbi:MAG: ATP-binding protein [Treponema sp.]|jgi:predicted ATPase|nr:ATP-binding protein [Treponema sp.]
MAAIGILIIGESGTGKSTSIRTLDPDKTGVITATGKRMPFKSDFKVVHEDNCGAIAGILKKCAADVIVIDDMQYLLARQFMDRAKELGYQKFTDMALGYYNVINALEDMPDNKRVYFLSHIERDNNGYEKVKTIGKLLDEKITIEGLFTIVLKTVVRDGQYYFSTHNSGSDTVKSPIGMFAEDLIPNGLDLVDRAVCEYYGIQNKKEVKPSGIKSLFSKNKEGAA